MTQNELAAALEQTWDTAEVMTDTEYAEFLSPGDPAFFAALKTGACFARVSRGSWLIVLPLTQGMLDSMEPDALVAMLNSRLEYKYRDLIDPGWERREYEAALAGVR